MSDLQMPKPGERYLAVDTTRCRVDCDCLPCRVCPVEAIRRAEGEVSPTVNRRECLLCGGCLKACAPGALSIRRG